MGPTNGSSEARGQQKDFRLSNGLSNVVPVCLTKLNSALLAVVDVAGPELRYGNSPHVLSEIRTWIISEVENLISVHQQLLESRTRNLHCVMPRNNQDLWFIFLKVLIIPIYIYIYTQMYNLVMRIHYLSISNLVHLNSRGKTKYRPRQPTASQGSLCVAGASALSPRVAGSRQWKAAIV